MDGGGAHSTRGREGERRSPADQRAGRVNGSLKAAFGAPSGLGASGTYTCWPNTFCTTNSRVKPITAAIRGVVIQPEAIPPERPT